MAKTKPSFEDTLAELEGIIAELESGSLPLDKMLERYEKGAKALELCRTMLDKAEKRIEILVRDKDGNLKPQPFEPEPEE